MPLAFGGRNVADLGVGYEIDVEAQSGQAILRVPIPVPPGRGGLGPAFTLTYTSAAGNSPFGAGWSLAGLPTIGIDTRKRLPRWDGTDGYRLGGEELVPWLEEQAGGWRPRGFTQGPWSVAFFRSRLGGAQVRVGGRDIRSVLS